MLLQYSGPIIILFFLLITYIISAYEKINGWKTTKIAFKKMYAKTFVAKAIVPLLVAILAGEVVIVTFAALAIFDILTLQNFRYANYAFIASSILCLFLLIGLRLIEDYQGASRIGIYFTISIFGMYWVQSMFTIA